MAPPKVGASTSGMNKPRSKKTSAPMQEKSREWKKQIKLGKLSP
jgi:hypothetical protein